MKNGMKPETTPPFIISFVKLFGLLAVIVGILGMHTLGFEPPSTGSAPAASAASADTADTALVQESSVESQQVNQAQQTVTDTPGSSTALACNVGNNGAPDLMVASCGLSSVVNGVFLLFVPHQVRLNSGTVLWGPKRLVAPDAPQPSPPSLEQLSIRRI